FHGPVRVPEEAANGTATLALSMSPWPTGNVAPATTDLPIAASLPESEQLINTLKGHKEVVSIVAYSPDGRVLASGTTQGKVLLWHPSSVKLLRTLIDNRPNLSSIAFSPDSRVLAVGRYRQQHGRMSGEIELWDISSGKLERSLKEENGGAVRRIGFLPDGK